MSVPIPWRLDDSQISVTRYFAFLLAFSYSAAAAEPSGFFGSWKQIFDKSGGTIQPAVKSATVQIKPAGENRVSVLMSEVAESGKTNSDEYVFSLDGSPAKYPVTPRARHGRGAR
jgi:hypothetical protein